MYPGSSRPLRSLDLSPQNRLPSEANSHFLGYACFFFPGHRLRRGRREQGAGSHQARGAAVKEEGGGEGEIQRDRGRDERGSREAPHPPRGLSAGRVQAECRPSAGRVRAECGPSVGGGVKWVTGALGTGEEPQEQTEPQAGSRLPVRSHMCHHHQQPLG